ncbi:hypothetical protein ATE48_16170 [Candidatus Viadribacter manganicus]|uniref:Uncharacterized protein n=2 Tax=Candidatus Viadribacter manganicus TaxID=1759059 RepID=A0A1B1ALE1_9PROT|nr:hypothetical protein ATE48_16170 [Candidatus Viadribacter manganicus]
MLTSAAFAQSTPNGPPVPVQEGTAVVQEDGAVRSGEQITDGSRPDPDAEVICRVIQETGSRLARRRQRVCGTRTMWEQLADQTADSVRGTGANTARRD